jgi:hypothetical protein
VDLMPIQRFVDGFTHKEIWKKGLEKNSPFMRLLNIPDLFVMLNMEKFEFAKF